MAWVVVKLLVVDGFLSLNKYNISTFFNGLVRREFRLEIFAVSLALPSLGPHVSSVVLGSVVRVEDVVLA